MIDFTMPSLGADMDEAMLVGWLVAPGDRVSRGDVIAEVETDKGIMEVECWDDGVIEELLMDPGSDKLPVGTPLARIRTDAEAAGEPEAGPEADSEGGTRAERAPEPERDPVTVGASATTGGQSVPVAQPHHATSPISPPVRHLAHQMGVDLEAVTPTGPDATITRDDVRRAAHRGRRRVSPLARKLAADRGIDLASVQASGPAGMVVASDLGTREAAPSAPSEAAESKTSADPAAAMRNAIARSMSRSNREIPQYSLVTRIDMKRSLDWLSAENAERPITARLLPAALFAKATALALREVAELNGHFEDEHFVASDDINLGMAISLRTGGLVAPAIFNADTLTLDELMTALDDLVKRARSWKLRTSEMASATATLTNLGDRGVGTAFPIVIPPQVAIVGLGRVMERPVAVDGLLAVRPTVDATLTADHRVSDGHRGGLFLAALDQRLQKPEEL